MCAVGGLMRNVVVAMLMVTSFHLAAEKHTKHVKAWHQDSSAEIIFSQLRAQYTGDGAKAPPLEELNVDQSRLPLLICVKKTWSASSESFKYEKFEGLLNQFKDVERMVGGKVGAGPGLSVSVSEVGGAVGKMTLPELAALRKKQREQHATLYGNKLPSVESPIAQPKNDDTQVTDEDGKSASFFQREVQTSGAASGPRHITQYFVRKISLDENEKLLVKIVETYRPDISKPAEDHSVSYCLRARSVQNSGKKLTQ
jgi:hypothetical protein